MSDPQAGVWCRRHKADQRWQRLVTRDGKEVKLFCTSLLLRVLLSSLIHSDHTPNVCVCVCGCHLSLCQYDWQIKMNCNKLMYY